MVGIFFGSLVIVVVASYLLKDTRREGGFVNTGPGGFEAPVWTVEQYPTGEKRAEGHMKGTKKEGRWTYFNTAGDTLLIEVYETGRLKEQTSFDN